MILPEGRQCMGISYIEKDSVVCFQKMAGGDQTSGVDVHLCVRSLFGRPCTLVEALGLLTVYMLQKLEAAAVLCQYVQMLYRKILEEFD